MNAMQEKLFLELRQTKEEVEFALNNKQSQDWLTTILKEELSDTITAIQKLENGDFGKCEISGEFLPNDLLKMIPTLKSQEDSEYLVSYFKKPIYHSF